MSATRFRTELKSYLRLVTLRHVTRDNEICDICDMVLQ